MVTKEYAIAAAEVNKVLSYLPEYEIEKIPKSLREFLNQIEDKKADIYIDPTIVSLYDQEVSSKAKEILAMIYTYYFASLEEITDLPLEVIDDAKEASEEIFGNKTQEEFEEEVEKGDVEITKIPREPWYKRLFSWIKWKK